MNRIVIVTGSRDLREAGLVYDYLDGQLAIAKSLGQRLIVYEGQCPYGGADLHAYNWVRIAINRGEQVGHKVFPPDLKQHGSPAAFHIRNREMIADAVKERNEGRAAVEAGAFPGRGNGTKGVIAMLKKNGVNVEVKP